MGSNRQIVGGRSPLEHRFEFVVLRLLHEKILTRFNRDLCEGVAAVVRQCGPGPR